MNYTNSSCTVFNQNVLMLQNFSIPPPPSPPPPHSHLYTTDALFNKNVSIPPYCILPIHSSTKCFNTAILYTSDAHFYDSLMKIAFISFFSSSDMHQSYHLLRCHAIAINSSFHIFINPSRIFFYVRCIFQI